MGAVSGLNEKAPSFWTGKTVLITGGTGSFGKECAAYLLKHFSLNKLIIFSRDELKQHEMRTGVLDAPCLRYFIGDVRDRDRLTRALNGVDVVIHAAALKQVPSCEYNPMEAISTNILGTRNVVEASLDAGVKRVIMLSTDKAVNPINLYGATKLCAEKLVVHSNAYSGANGTKFGCVRYGNVVGSRGSVVPIFLKQRETGTLTITDERMTRFWITLDHGVRFVLQCAEEMDGGEVFVPKIPSMSLLELAKTIGPNCKIHFTGIRPGEKLYEVLLAEDEARNAYEREDRYVIYPPQLFLGAEPPKGQPVAEGFSFTSDNNAHWLSGSELSEIITASKLELGLMQKTAAKLAEATA